MKIATIVGARPQFIKAAPVSDALRAAGHTELLIHTGQHYDYAMSQVFFEGLGLPDPAYNLGIGSGRHGWQTGQMLAAIEDVLLREQPDSVLIYGDTNSTAAGALAAVKIPLPLAHVEAGLRSRNRAMPEEHNRIVADHLADLLFCPTQAALDNLAQEGLDRRACLVGDTMYDALLRYRTAGDTPAPVLERLGLQRGEYLLATVHRPYNTDVPDNLAAIMSAFHRAEWPIVLPVHPRTKHRMAGLGMAEADQASNVRLIEPVGYLDMLALEQNARLVLTDSGGIQKEAYLFGVPCITLRPETEWVETVQTGWNRVVGTDQALILEAVHSQDWPQGQPPPLFGDGHAAEAIVGWLERHVEAKTAQMEGAKA